MSKALEDGLNDSECADKLAEWASSEMGMSASHPAGNGDDGNSRKDRWPPPEGTAPAPPEEKKSSCETVDGHIFESGFSIRRLSPSHKPN